MHRTVRPRSFADVIEEVGSLRRGVRSVFGTGSHVDRDPTADAFALVLSPWWARSCGSRPEVHVDDADAERGARGVGMVGSSVAAVSSVDEERSGGHVGRGGRPLGDPGINSHTTTRAARRPVVGAVAAVVADDPSARSRVLRRLRARLRRPLCRVDLRTSTRHRLWPRNERVTERALRAVIHVDGPGLTHRLVNRPQRNRGAGGYLRIPILPLGSILVWAGTELIHDGWGPLPMTPIAAVVFLCVQLFLPRARWDPTHMIGPADAALLLFGLQLTVLPTLINVFGVFGGPLTVLPAKGAVNLALLLQAIGYVGFAIGVSLRRNRTSVMNLLPPRYSIDPAWPDVRRHRLSRVGVALPLGIGARCVLHGSQ